LSFVFLLKGKLKVKIGYSITMCLIENCSKEYELNKIISDHIWLAYSAGGFRVRRSFLRLIWLACIWVVWTERNHRLFWGSANTPTQMLDNIKLHSFRWLKVTSVTLVLYSVWVLFEMFLVIFMRLFINSGSLPWHILC
jgi:hypothetical protein